MQTNLHRVSEFAVTAEEKADDVKHEVRAAIKRLRENDTDSESDVDDIVGKANISSSMVDVSGQGGVTSDAWHDSFKSENAENGSAVFLSFDWKNEDPYEKTVERYLSFILAQVHYFL